ncbi:MULTISPECIES: AMIN-like domain-containing (lipo)protein [Streptomyces]|uniref:AMIN-like domain-containing (lipo)protein n=1 Tax=Streptomyces TaxID=1883 RepID=UPI0022490CAC|nr:hypothetical protein [Streptomyces sp. JHD 1]MCX2971716.1 hypothetical protein [Streptomyces sp. JHD 1]
MARRRTTALSLAALTATAALTLTACGTEGAGDTGAAGTAETAERSAAPEEPATPEEPAAPEDDASPDPASGDFGTHEVRGGGDGFALRPDLRDVRLTEHADYDRLTFTFSGGTPGYIAHYMDPLAHGGRGEVTEVPGEHGLKLVLVGMDNGTEVTFEDSSDTVRGVRGMGVFEGELGVGIGVDSAGEDPAGFRVTTDATTLTLDIAHG